MTVYELLPLHGFQKMADGFSIATKASVLVSKCWSTTSACKHGTYASDLYLLVILTCHSRFSLFTEDRSIGSDLGKLEAE